MNEILKRIINCLLAGFLVLLGACTAGVPTQQEFFVAMIASAVVAVTQFKDFWKEYEKMDIKSTTIFSFIV